MMESQEKSAVTLRVIADFVKYIGSLKRNLNFLRTLLGSSTSYFSLVSGASVTSLLVRVEFLP